MQAGGRRFDSDHLHQGGPPGGPQGGPQGGPRRGLLWSRGKSRFWPRVVCGLFFAIVDRVNLDFAGIVRGLGPGRIWRGPGLDERV